MKINELLGDELKWTQNCFARDSKGCETWPLNSNAVCWCLAGAITRCYSDQEYVETYCKISGAIKKLFSGRNTTITKFNDEATFEEIQQVLKEANV